MAKRRMLSIPIVETDKFYSLTSGAQALYVHLNLNADDDGVVDRVKLILNQMKVRRKCYEELLLGGYIIELEDGLIVITHWHEHNQIRKDRYVKGEYLDRLSSLSLQENGRFIKASCDVLVDKCVPQDSIVKDSIEKDSIAKVSTDKGRSAEHRADQEKEEKKKNNISFLHTNYPESVASLPDVEEQKIDSLSFGVILTLLRLYFMKNYTIDDMDKFVKYYESRGWIGEKGIISKVNYKYYADKWMIEKKGNL